MSLAKRLPRGSTGGWQYLYGESGNDTYLYGTESRQVYISSSEGKGRGNDTVVFKDLRLEDVTFTSYDYTKGGTVKSNEGNSLRILWKKDGQSGELRIANMGEHIEKFVFADGTRVDGFQVGNSYADMFSYDAVAPKARHTEVIARFDEERDRIDLSDFDVAFGDLSIAEVDGETHVGIDGTGYKIRILGDDHELSASNFQF